MITDRTLFVTWFDPKRRAIMPVARLVHRRGPTSDVYEFRYIRGAVEATDHGFLPFIAFPDLHKVYRSVALFPFFANRVMPTTRPDYLECIRALGIEPPDADSMAILARSGGKRETDRIEVVPAPTPDEAGVYTTHFLLRGIRYIPGAEERITRLVPGERLLWMLDAQNDANSDAIALRTVDKQLLGYVPNYLLTDIATLVERRIPLDISVEQVNPLPSPLHYRLLCRLDARWPEGFVPFDGERFQPVEERTSATAEIGLSG